MWVCLWAVLFLPVQCCPSELRRLHQAQVPQVQTNVGQRREGEVAVTELALLVQLACLHLQGVAQAQLNACLSCVAPA